MIELHGVTKVYPRRGGEAVTALDDLSLTIPDGEIHGIVGESGAGKSTLIRCLTALEKPTSGSILVDGKDLTILSDSHLRAERRHIGMVFQGANLFEARTAADNIAYPLKVAGVSKAERNERVAELLDIVGLAGRGGSYPAQMSGGQRQRVGIARALADRPSVVLADEPTSALDMETTEQILALLKDVRDRLGVTIVVITHEMSVVRKICTSATLLDAGKIVESGSIEHTLANPNSKLAKKLVPLPDVDPRAVGDDSVVDIYFTSSPGIPTGSRVMTRVAELGADISAGLFESVGEMQVGRMALALASDKVPQALAAFAQDGIHAEVRSL
ncbi:methionine ABC transporter ATP-binding protein [Trueperella pecoris]|uniref:Methionine ABC transporter ATP-binding protein n=1 Tax=Trueperella pecoris TaxID=2733571 RepID=A0A7M1QSS0_9ACTO|nr:methionine ABC transporter ATP-binding protein [Trueperella pecoris]QOQ38658.1 methionine ABC transporter ATP-binding protein [Trueperella pecoris]QOR44851.1 methionine ABC transporter ATP-binding protein [Trueperella pecoris]QTG74773.1 methionine ABC transporter ATP-binding protein [Trueperella pecoris]